MVLSAFLGELIDDLTAPTAILSIILLSPDKNPHLTSEFIKYTGARVTSESVNRCTEKIELTTPRIYHVATIIDLERESTRETHHHEGIKADEGAELSENWSWLRIGRVRRSLKANKGVVEAIIVHTPEHLRATVELIRANPRAFFGAIHVVTEDKSCSVTVASVFDAVTCGDNNVLINEGPGAVGNPRLIPETLLFTEVE